MTTNFDIVYVLKNNIIANELIYSLRSVEQNFPYNKIYFYGGNPKGISPDVQVPFVQQGETKAERVVNSLCLVCENEEITDDFWLFNDDFFILNKVIDCPPIYDGTLVDWFLKIEQKRGKSSTYTRRIRKTNEYLINNGYSNLNYCVHIPMLINKKKALPILKEFKDYSFRALYGNIYNIGGVQHSDVKISSKTKGLDTRINDVYASTNEKSFNEGLVGEQIRNKFTIPSKYELLV